MFTLEQQENMMKYWEHQTRPTEKMIVESVVPVPAVITYEQDQTPVHLLSYPFFNFEDTQRLSLLNIAKQNPEDTLVKSFAPKGFAGHLGDFLAEKKIFDPQHPAFNEDVAIISRHCAITTRKSRKGESTDNVVEFTVNARSVREENQETWTRYLQTSDSFQKYRYSRKCDVHRDINIPE